MTDITIKYTEKMVGAGHPSLADTLNRFMLVEHEVDGTHKLSIDISFVDIRGQLPDGYVSDGSVVYRTQIKAAADKAVANGIPLFIPPGMWNTDIVLETTAEIFGLTPNKCILYNSGIGDALDLSGASYYNHYAGFQVKGNIASRDGIVLYTELGDNAGYIRFTEVDSLYHGRHGVLHKRAWGTQYMNCNFSYNEGLGFYSTAEASDGGGANSLVLFMCQVRWNGGINAATTYSDYKGGISINGGNCVTIEGCTIESNNAWQILTGQDTYQGLNVLNIHKCYLEGRGPNTATVGGTLYFNKGSKISVTNCEIGFAASLGDTSYAYFIDTSANVGTIYEDNNQYSGGGAGTELLINAGKTLKRPIHTVVTKQMGDTGAGGVPVAQTLLTASNDGEYKITGTIHCGRNSEQGESFPFIATRYQSARSVSIGNAITTKRNFDAWDTTKVPDFSYFALTDMIIHVWCNFTAGNTGVSALTGSPTANTEVNRMVMNGAYTVAAGITFHCKKGSYYKIALVGVPASVTISTLSVGTVELTTIAPTIAWSGNNLQVTWEAYHVGYIEFSYSYSSLPSQFSLNATYLQRSDELANLPF